MAVDFIEEVEISHASAASWQLLQECQPQDQEAEIPGPAY